MSTQPVHLLIDQEIAEASSEATSLVNLFPKINLDKSVTE